MNTDLKTIQELYWQQIKRLSVPQQPALKGVLADFIRINSNI